MAETKAYSGSHLDENGNVILEDVPQGKRNVKTREFADTIKVADDVLVAVPKADVPTGKREGVKTTAFADTVKDENGNLHAVPYPDFVKDSDK